MGRGNSRLIAWEGERTLTWNMQDALLSPESFSVLTGAGLISAPERQPMSVHTTSQVEVKTKNTIVLDELACWITKPTGASKETYKHDSAQIFCMKLNDRGEVISEPCIPASVEHTDNNTTTTIKCHADGENTTVDLDIGDIVLVDYYTLQTGTNATTIEITPDKFGGYYYGTSNKEWNVSDVVIMAPQGVKNLNRLGIRQNCFIIYIDIPYYIRNERLCKRDSSNIDEIKKRLLNDEREFDGFKDYDLKIENPNF